MTAPFKTGDAVRITYEGRTVDGRVQLASPNGLSLMLQFEALLSGYVGAMAVLAGSPDGAYRDLIRGERVALEPITDRPGLDS